MTSAPFKRNCWYFLYLTFYLVSSCNRFEKGYSESIVRKEIASLSEAESAAASPAGEKDPCPEGWKNCPDEGCAPPRPTGGHYDCPYGDGSTEEPEGTDSSEECPIIEPSSCSTSSDGGCTGGCVPTEEGAEVAIAVEVPLTPIQQLFIQVMGGTRAIIDIHFEAVMGELPNSRLSRELCSRIGTNEPPCWRAVEFGEGVTILFEKRRGTEGYYEWFPVKWAPASVRPDLDVHGKLEELLGVYRNQTQGYTDPPALAVAEFLIMAFPGVYGANELINGEQKVLGAVSLAADLATFGIAKGVTVLGKTVLSANTCRAIVVTGAAARISNAVQNPSLGTGIDAALATIEGSLVGVKFVSVVIRGGRGYIKGGASSAARAVAESAGKNLDDIALNGNGPGLTCSELARLGVRVRVNGGSTVYVERLVGTELVPEAMSRNTKVYRCEMPNTCPFQVHESPFFNKVDYGLLDRADFDVTYIHTSRETLERLRTKQGYFEAGCCIRESTLGEVMEKAGPNSRALIDYKANATVGGDGTSIVVIKPNPW